MQHLLAEPRYLGALVHHGFLQLPGNDKAMLRLYKRQAADTVHQYYKTLVKGFGSLRACYVPGREGSRRHDSLPKSLGSLRAVHLPGAGFEHGPAGLKPPSIQAACFHFFSGFGNFFAAPGIIGTNLHSEDKRSLEVGVNTLRLNQRAVFGMASLQ